MDLSPVTSMTLRGWRMSFLPFNEVGKALQVPITRQTHISSWEGQNGAEQNFLGRAAPFIVHENEAFNLEKQL